MRASVWAIGLLVVLSGTAAAQSARAKVDMNAPAPRMEFRDLTEDMLKPGMTIGVTAYRSKARPGEFRAESITVAKRTFDLR